MPSSPAHPRLLASGVGTQVRWFRSTSLSIEDVSAILRLATELEAEEPRTRAMRLAHRRVALLFYESSTRTRTSFELAAKGLGADTALISSQSSSIEKGESLKDTGITLRGARRGMHYSSPSFLRSALPAGQGYWFAGIECRGTGCMSIRHRRCWM